MATMKRLFSVSGDGFAGRGRGSRCAAPLTGSEYLSSLDRRGGTHAEMEPDWDTFVIDADDLDFFGALSYFQVTGRRPDGTP